MIGQFDEAIARPAHGKLAVGFGAVNWLIKNQQDALQGDFPAPAWFAYPLDGAGGTLKAGSLFGDAGMIEYCLWRSMVSSARHLARAAALLLLAGCSAARPPPPDDAASVSAADVLRRCGAAHRDLKTLQARGSLRDFRPAADRVFPIEWCYSRPDRCRLQIGMDVAVVSGEQWWAFHSKTGEFRKHRQFTRTPIETAAYLLSDGIPFLLPTLLARGETAFSAGRLGRPEQWQLEGVAWHAEAPCYVLARHSQVQGQGEMLRIWVDQDRFLLRGWTISGTSPDGRERPILECSYPEVVPDGKLPPDWLQLKPPAPLKLPVKAA